MCMCARPCDLELLKSPMKAPVVPSNAEMDGRGALSPPSSRRLRSARTSPPCAFAPLAGPTMGCEEALMRLERRSGLGRLGTHEIASESSSTEHTLIAPDGV